MKYPLMLILLTLPPLSQAAEAPGLDPSVTDLILKAAEDTNKVNGLIKKVGVPQTECREVEKHLNRSVLNRDPSVPVITCVPDETSLASPTGEDYSQFIRDYNIEFHPGRAAIEGTREFRLFIHELKKFPPSLLKEMAEAGGKIRVMVGDGVTVDPGWEQERLRQVDLVKKSWEYYYKYGQKNGYPAPTVTEADINKSYLTTTEGTRNWDYVSGAGGVFSNPNFILPTRIVINRMYKSLHKLPDGTMVEWDQGATNLVLHEHGHALDNLYGHHAVSSSPEWRALVRDPSIKSYTDKIFSTYENGFEEEGFAEAFSYYHSCEASRKQMETHAPRLAEFIKNLTSIKKLRPDYYEAWRKTYKK